MPSSSRLFVKPFIGGLNTELSSVEDAILNTSDELNCTILPEGIRGRRLGFNIERDGKWIETNESIRSRSVYYWNNVYTDVSYIVVQIDQVLYIYPDQDPMSQQEPVFTYEIPVTNFTDIDKPLSITGVSNGLFVVGKWCFPFVIKYDIDLQRFYVIENNLKYRDFNGVDDGYLVDELPSIMTKQHLYNLKNQGWDKYIIDPETSEEKYLLPDENGEGLFFDQYAEDHGFGRYPANNLQWFVGKEKSGDYNTTDLLNKYIGNTPAPKGHYILDYKNRSRNKVSGIEVDRIEVPEGEVHLNYKDNVGDKEEVVVLMAFAMLTTPTSEFKRVWGDYLTRLPANYRETYNLPGNISGNLQKLKITLNDIFLRPTFEDVDSNNDYWLINAKYRSRRYGSRIDTYLYAMPFKLKVFGRTSQGDDVELYSLDTQLDDSPAGTSKTYDIDLSSNLDNYITYYIALDFSDIPANTEVFKSCQLEYDVTVQKLNSVEEGEGVYEGLPVSDMLKGAVSKIESFGGRLFYLCNDVVLFSQTLNADLKNYDKCYQEADPTSEEISDIVATDGGVINMLTIGKGLNMKRFNRGIIVFGDNEISGIISPLNNLFTANEYDIVKISNAGLLGEYSVVSTNDKIYYWSVHGIFEIGIEQNTVYSKCISNETIQRFYMELSEVSKQKCIGYFDYANNRIYWFYPTDNIKHDRLDGCLVLDLTHGCFMPQKIDAGDVVRDEEGRYIGVLQNFNQQIKLNNNSLIDCVKTDGIVYDKNENILGYCNTKYITDCTSSIRVKQTKPVIHVSVNGDNVKIGNDNVVHPIKYDPRYSPKSSGIILVADTDKYSFGSFNDSGFKDWGTSPYNSYMVSRPIMFAGFSAFGNAIQDTANDKQVPILQTLFKRTEQSRLEPYKAPVKYVKSNEPVVTSFRTYARKSVDSIKGFIESVNVHVDLSEFEKNIWTVNLRVFGVDEDNRRTTIASKSVNVFNNPIDTIDEILTTTDTINYSRYDLEVEVFHGSSDTTGAEQVSAMFALTINTGTSVDKYNYIATSGANIRVRWGWSLTDRSNRWDMMQNGYRPQKDFLHDEYVESRIHVRGRGKAFQVEIRNDGNKDFRLAGMNLLVRSK